MKRIKNKRIFPKSKHQEINTSCSQYSEILPLRISKSLTVYQLKFWHLTFVTTVTAVECNIVVVLCAGFYQKSRVFIFAADVLFYKVCYVQFIISVVRKGAAFNGECGIRRAAL